MQAILVTQYVYSNSFAFLQRCNWFVKLTSGPSCIIYYDSGLTHWRILPKWDGSTARWGPAHTSNHTTEYFMMAGMTPMDWVPRSVDINCIYNCCGLLSHALYDGGRQFDTVEDLCKGLVYEWEKLRAFKSLSGQFQNAFCRSTTSMVVWLTTSCSNTAVDDWIRKVFKILSRDKMCLKLLIHY